MQQPLRNLAALHQRELLARVLLNHLLTCLELGLLPGSHCDFCKGHETTNMIFAMGQIQRKCQEQNCEHYTRFDVQEGAFDTVSQQDLGRWCQSSAALPNSFRWYITSDLKIIIQFYKKTKRECLSGFSPAKTNKNQYLEWKKKK